MKRNRTFALDRYTLIGEFAASLKRLLRKRLWLFYALFIVESAYLFFSGKPGAYAFMMIAGSCLFTLQVWSRNGIGLPMLPLLALQNLVIYSSPIVFGHASVALAKESQVFQAGLEVLVFGAAMTAAWWAGMHVFSPSLPVSYVLVDVHRGGSGGLSRMGFILAGIGTGYLVLQSLGLTQVLIDRLPAGAYSIVFALVSGASTCGFFTIALSFGSERAGPVKKLAFWALLLANSIITTSTFLLSAVSGNVLAAAIGLFWGSGKVPWRFGITVALILSFLNVGKFSMREKYWPQGPDEASLNMDLVGVPARYSEWIQASYAAMSQPGPASAADAAQAQPDSASHQSLMDRIDNLQNLLFVINAEEDGHMEPLHGETYMLIPALLIPRILWEGKPRTHQGQVLLNVHFGRQDLNSTFTTYVAWGLLPEAYGNFGPFWGALSLGVLGGIFFAWVENRTARKLVISLEGIVGFGLILNMLNSWEMVASVLATSTFQSLLPTFLAFAPFVRRQKLLRPEPENN
ncbi:MAG: hypothetical protein ABSA05_03760 [Opitutaceae bacterium]